MEFETWPPIQLQIMNVVQRGQIVQNPPFFNLSQPLGNSIVSLLISPSSKWKQERQGTFVLTGEDAEEVHFFHSKGGETMLQEQLGVITDGPRACVSAWLLTSVTGREDKQWAVSWEDRKHNT